MTSLLCAQCSRVQKLVFSRKKAAKYSGPVARAIFLVAASHDADMEGKAGLFGHQKYAKVTGQ